MMNFKFSLSLSFSHFNIIAGVKRKCGKICKDSIDMTVQSYIMAFVNKKMTMYLKKQHSKVISRK